MDRIVIALQELSRARSPEQVDTIVREASEALSAEHLAALTESASITKENLARAAEQTATIQAANAELKSLASAVSHDLRAPVRSVLGFILALEEDAGDVIPPEAKKHIERVKGAATRMNELIEAMVALSQVTRAEMTLRTIDVSALAGEIITEQRRANPTRAVTTIVQPGIEARADARLLRVLLTNLLSNAWKFSSKQETATIEVGQKGREIFVRDDGAGFDMAYVHKLFVPFQRLVSPTEYPGAGVGLAAGARIVRRHGGQIRAEAAVGKGATISFSLSAPPP